MSKVYQLITDRIIAALETGNVPWRKPWGGDGYLARNLDSKKKYRGINAFLLTMHGYDQPWRHHVHHHLRSRIKRQTNHRIAEA